MSAKTSANNLVTALKDLSYRWQETQAFWHDIKSREFEQTYIADLPGHVSRAVAVMEEIDGLIRKVRSDCE